MAVISAALSAIATYVGTTGAVIFGHTITAMQAAAIATAAGVYTYSGVRAAEKAANAAGASIESTAGNAKLNKRANNAPIPVIYGAVRIGGTIVFTDTHRDWLSIVLVISEGQVNKINGIYFNDIPASHNQFRSDDDVSYYNVNFKDGSVTQTAVSTLVQWYSGYNNSHKLSGTAYLNANFKFNAEMWGGRIPLVTVDVEGMRVYDPRYSEVRYSTNPAMCIRDYLTNTRYGRALDASSIDDDSFIRAANYCDEVIELNNYTRVERYTCNGIVETQYGSISIVTKMLSSCRGSLNFTGGKYKLIIDKPEIPIFTFNEDNIIGKWEVALGDKTTRFNRMRANFFNRAKDRELDIAVADSPTFRAEDGVLLETTLDLPFTDTLLKAKTILNVHLRQSRYSIVCSFTALIEAVVVEVGDVVYIKHPRMGWDTFNNNKGKKFRIFKWMKQNNDEIRIVATEYDDEVYNIEPIEDTDPAPVITLPDLSTTLPPTNLTTSESLYTTTNSSGVKARLEINWTATEDVYVVNYEVEHKLSDVVPWTQLTTTEKTSALFDDVTPGHVDVRVRAINTRGVASPWLYLNNILVEGLTAPPGDIQNLSNTALDGSALLSWDMATELDVQNNGTVLFKHSDLITGATWNDAISSQTVASGSSTSITLPLVEGTYLAKFIDSSNNESVNATATVIESVPNDLIIVAELPQQPTFSGAMSSYLVVVNDTLQFKEPDNIDDPADNIDDPADNIDDLVKEATYEFDDYIDLGIVRTYFIYPTLIVTSATPDVVVDTFYAWTDDDPSGSPTWSDWSSANVGIGRAVKIKIELSSDNYIEQLYIPELSVEVSTRAFREHTQGVISGTLPLTITYVTPFTVTPTVSITVSDNLSGDYFQVTSKTSTGFTIAFFDSNDSAISRTFDYNADGY